MGGFSQRGGVVTFRVTTGSTCRQGFRFVSFSFIFLFFFIFLRGDCCFYPSLSMRVLARTCIIALVSCPVPPGIISIIIIIIIITKSVLRWMDGCNVFIVVFRVVLRSAFGEKRTTTAIVVVLIAVVNDVDVY
ncbi:hypothetical protein FN846DRAFT_957731 [Sphaerosporella brunnea]|uniref:Uncharacterized protein n=1 Tax=Sphaerosporella brunnea TaxID=1250544 RepID=A0A5J5EQV4_9PEZI|nr:hypothetical protein FN846DRAFT_957731 [Sphaerosporella brunnea]